MGYADVRLLRRYRFQSDDEKNKHGCKGHLPEGGRLMKEQYAQQHGAYRSDACPTG